MIPMRTTLPAGISSIELTIDVRHRRVAAVGQQFAGRVDVVVIGETEDLAVVELIPVVSDTMPSVSNGTGSPFGGVAGSDRGRAGDGSGDAAIASVAAVSRSGHGHAALDDGADRHGSRPAHHFRRLAQAMIAPARATTEPRTTTGRPTSSWTSSPRKSTQSL